MNLELLSMPAPDKCLEQYREMSMVDVTLNEMVDALEYGRTFYIEAAEHADRDDLRILFEGLAVAKQAMLDDLCVAPIDGSEHSGEGSGFAEKLKTIYAGIKANWDVDKDHRYLASLVASEDQILHAFGSAVVHSDDSNLREVARKHLQALIDGHRKLLKLRYGQPVRE